MSARCVRRRRRCPQTPPPTPARLWELAELEASGALQAWSRAPVADRHRAYFAYCVALEREECAAADLAGSSS